MRAAVIAAAIATSFVSGACGGSKPPAAGPGSGSASGSAAASDDDTLSADTTPKADSPIHARRNAACEKVGAKVAACAVEDTRNDKAHPPTADELRDLPKTEEIDKREFIKKCVASEMSSRQVRVMEVCVAKETECDPFLACLDHMNDSEKQP
jgi:hypothetical protein